MLAWLTKWLVRTPPGAVALRPVEAAPDDAAPQPLARPVDDDVVRLHQVLSALRGKGFVLPVDALSALGRALVGHLKAAPGAHLEGTRPADVLLTRAGLVRVRSAGARRAHRAFLSPELVRGFAADEASDVFTICGLLFTAAANGQGPFQHDSELRSLRAIVEGDSRSLSALRTDLPASFVELVQRGLSTQANDRLTSLSELERALETSTGNAEAGHHLLFTTAFSLVEPSRPAPPVRSAHEAQVLEAIGRGDEPARLVYADLLEERGLADEARWLRLEAMVQRASADERQPLLRELDALRSRVGREFMAAVGRTALEGCPIVFGFRCPMRWEQLVPTREPTVRYCPGCDSKVTYFDSVEQAQRASWAGECVAIDPSVERSEDDLEPFAVMGRIA